LKVNKILAQRQPIRFVKDDLDLLALAEKERIKKEQDELIKRGKKDGFVV